MTELQIDWTRCDGHGLCAALLPQTITRDEWGYPVFRRRELRPADIDDARRVVQVCPSMALRLGEPGRS